MEIWTSAVGQRTKEKDSVGDGTKMKLLLSGYQEIMRRPCACRPDDGAARKEDEK